MNNRIVAPLPGWNVRGYSYAELQPNGEQHPGLDMNVGYGDEDLGLPVVAFADGVVIERKEWSGHSYGFGNAVLLEHHLFPSQPTPGPGADAGEADGDPKAGGVGLWTVYAHLDSFDEAAQPGAAVSAGQRLGACGKTGNQTWAHLHFEVRREGPPRMPIDFWGGRLNHRAQSSLYADPFTLLCVLEGLDLSIQAPELLERLAVAEADLRVLRADRDFNYRLKMEMEAFIRRLEGRRLRVPRGKADLLIAGAG